LPRRSNAVAHSVLIPPTAQPSSTSNDDETWGDLTGPARCAGRALIESPART
jgi:hypothetical protein